MNIRNWYHAVNTYNNRTVLRGHENHILCLAVADSGKLLASGGEFRLSLSQCYTDLSGGGDGLIVWSLEDMVQLHRISTFNVRGATTAITWIRRDDSPEEGFVYGTLEGYITFCRYKAEVSDSTLIHQTNAYFLGEQS